MAAEVLRYASATLMVLLHVGVNFKPGPYCPGLFLFQWGCAREHKIRTSAGYQCLGASDMVLVN